ncbi:MAG: hypothetical protein RIC07_00370 [Coleofasciculus sp. E1-EBD-02]
MGCGVWGVGYGVWGVGYGVWGMGYGVWGMGCGVWGVGYGVWGVGYGVWGMGCEKQGLRSSTTSSGMRIAILVIFTEFSHKSNHSSSTLIPKASVERLSY